MELTLVIVSSEERHCLAPASVKLSSANEATIRYMFPVASVIELQVELRNDQKVKVCETGPIRLTDEDWICLKSTRCITTGEESRLLSCMKDVENGWSLCIDLKEQSDGKQYTYILCNVRVLWSSTYATMEGSNASRNEDSISCNKIIDADCLDCDDPTAATYLNMRSHAAFSKANGKVCQTHHLLRKLLRLDDTQLPAELLEPSLWNAMSRGLTVENTMIASTHPNIDRDSFSEAASQVESVGYGSLQNLSWSELGISFQALAETIDVLREHGFPPVFIFMYDQPWVLLEHLFESMSVVMGSVDVKLDASVFAWALQSSQSESPGEHRHVGNNFGKPHRDYNFTRCHTEDSKLSILTVWIPLVPVTVDNGCMYVVPASCDTLLEAPDDPLHMQPDEQRLREHARPLPCAAGDVLFWRGDLVHWGSACGACVEQPRKSLGTAFMLPTDGHASKGDEALSREDVRAGLDMSERLKIILRSLLLYEHWYPTFTGLDTSKFTLM